MSLSRSAQRDTNCNDRHNRRFIHERIENCPEVRGLNEERAKHLRGLGESERLPLPSHRCTDTSRWSATPTCVDLRLLLPTSGAEGDDMVVSESVRAIMATDYAVA
jgi:hypothetical protein